MLKYIASIPVVLSLLAATYGAINYTSKLTNQIDKSTSTIALLKLEVENLEERVYSDIDNIHRTYTDKTGRNTKNYADAREELVKEMAEMATWVGRLEGILYALRDGSYKLASQAEYQALEGLVRANIESIREMGYDIKDIEKDALGGY
jgi:FtsZ-binding cell division protein ZapB